MNLSPSISLALLVIMTGFASLFAQPGPIKHLRYQDNFSHLEADTMPKRGLDRLKLIQVGEKGRLSIGGEYRIWWDTRIHANFGDLPPGMKSDPNGQFQQRSMLHANYETGNRIRVFGQIHSNWEWGSPNPPVPEIAYDQFGIHQLFLDFSDKSGRHTLRIGRQELSFGNEMLISSREGPNNRLSFDGISFLIRSPARMIHLLAATPVINQPGVFDNQHVEEWIWGAYGQWRLKQATHLDAYYFGMYSARRAYQFRPGTQHRHTIGSRVWNHGKYWYYDVEGMAQTGQFLDEWIAAFNVTGELRYIFRDQFWAPMVGMGASYVSGDLQPNDGMLNTFDPLYPKPVYGLAAPQGPSNISHINPMVGIQPLPSLFINARYYWLGRTSIHDGTYAPSMMQVRPTPDAESQALGGGHQYALDLFYLPNPHWAFISFISYLTPGNYIRETGAGKPIFFASGAVQWKF
ncbi:alginate export family protein [Pontibacter sp. G13]|uniref:alginate export family protein n=1 Tax=Pontibacter sp. G13 TaxID=3074898 RepID=UPI002889E5DC|nr:alginate export family protein [Pontibacter sp. G13]WNJ16422.1 alginate export family protein [Pontibacter sp. G13]